MTQHATLDCPRCGQRIVDLDVEQYIATGHSPDDFADMLARLTHAHVDTCTPARTPPSRANRVRRRWWRVATAVPCALWAVAAIPQLIDGSAAAVVAYLCAGFAYAIGRAGQVTEFRHGYFRGRREERAGRWPSVRDLHPADRTEELP